MKDKCIVCPCVDVSRAEIEQAVEDGSHDIRDIRMRSGAGSGICRGKYCIHHVIRIMSELLDRPPPAVGKPTQRQPVTDVSLGELFDEDRL